MLVGHQLWYWRNKCHADKFALLLENNSNLSNVFDLAAGASGFTDQEYCALGLALQIKNAYALYLAPNSSCPWQLVVIQNSACFVLFFSSFLFSASCSSKTSREAAVYALQGFKGTTHVVIRNKLT